MFGLAHYQISGQCSLCQLWEHNCDERGTACGVRLGFGGNGERFFWVIRPDLVAGDVAMVPPEFLAKTADRRMLVSWCPQEKFMSHPAIGGFLTHCGWNLILESICAGVHMACWPFFTEHQLNCKFYCDEWEIGIEISADVKRKEVQAVIRELMDGEKGKKMKSKVKEWQHLAKEAMEDKHGSSKLNFELVVNKLLVREEEIMLGK